jgi:hypothetical protein
MSTVQKNNIFKIQDPNTGVVFLVNCLRQSGFASCNNLKVSHGPLSLWRISRSSAPSTFFSENPMTREDVNLELRLLVALYNLCFKCRLEYKIFRIIGDIFSLTQKQREG